MSRIAIVTQRLLGHVLPILGVGKELFDRGHEVWVLSHANHQQLIEQTGMQFIEFGWDKFPDLYLKESMQQALDVINQLDFEIIICDSSLASPSYVAELLNIPFISFQTTVPLPDQKIPGNPDKNYRRRKHYEKQLNQVRISYSLPPLEDFTRTRGDFAGLSPILHLITVTKELVTSEEWLPKSSSVIGPCLLETLNPAPEIMKIDRTEMTTIIVCTTSVDRQDYRQITHKYISSCIDNFPDNSYQLYICHEPIPRFEPLPNNFCWVTTYPVHHTMMPYCDILITHGGCNTLQQGLINGVPMIIIPLGADHPVLAEKCKSLGVAEVVNPDRIDSTNMKNLVDYILSDSKFRKHAKQVSQKIQMQKSPNKIGADLVENVITQKDDDNVKC